MVTVILVLYFWFLICAAAFGEWLYFFILLLIGGGIVGLLIIRNAKKQLDKNQKHIEKNQPIANSFFKSFYKDMSNFSYVYSSLAFVIKPKYSSQSCQYSISFVFEKELAKEVEEQMELSLQYGIKFSKVLLFFGGCHEDFTLEKLKIENEFVRQFFETKIDSLDKNSFEYQWNRVFQLPYKWEDLVDAALSVRGWEICKDASCAELICSNEGDGEKIIIRFGEDGYCF